LAAVIAQGAQALRDDSGAGSWILLEQFGDNGLERIEFAGAVAACGWRRGCFQVLENGAPADVEMGGDFAHGPLLDTMEAVQVVDLIGGEHEHFGYTGSSGSRPRRCSFQDPAGATAVNA
jgi:hypothetical protein